MKLRPRRSKRAIFGALALFFVGQFFVGLALDTRYPLTRFPSAASAVQRASFESRPPEIIFFGSSRTMTGVVVPEANRILVEEFGEDNAPRTFNAGVVAGDSYSAELVFNQLLMRGIRPQWAILEVSPEMLGARPPFIGEHVRRQFTWEHLFTELPAMVRSNSAWSYLEARFAPIYTHRMQIVRQGKLAFRNHLPEIDGPAGEADAKTGGTGRGPVDNIGASVPKFAPRSDDPKEAEKLLATSQAGSQRVIRRWLRNYRIGGPAPPALERTLARCNAEGIHVILVGIPSCTAHRREFNYEILADYYGYINELVRQYGCQFVDASEWIPDLQFGDTLHLRSETGGIAFTKRFTREALLPALKQ